MKILFLGDSITEGYGASCYETSYVPLVAKKLNADVRNYGVSGTRIARQTFILEWMCHSNFDMNLRTEIMEKDADCVVLFGGTNDYGIGCSPLGVPEDTDVFTFYGAVNTLLDKLISTYGAEKLIIILPLPRLNEDNVDGHDPRFKRGLKTVLKQYVDIIRAAATKRNLFIADYSSSFKDENGLKEDLFVDGLHPNDKGHKLLSELLSKDILTITKSHK